VSDKRQPLVTDFLMLETGLALWFWLPYVTSVTLNVIWERWPHIGLAWFGAWMASPVLTLVGLLMVPRALRVQAGWLQVLIGSLLAASIWYQFTRMEF